CDENAGVAGGFEPITESACLAVLMPVFNEAATLRPLLARILKQPCVREVVAVDDGSTDGTLGILNEYVEHERRVYVFSHVKNQGKGAAIRTGLQQIRAPIVIIQDADLEYHPEDYERLLEPIRLGKSAVVYGSRFLEKTRGPLTRNRW